MKTCRCPYEHGERVELEPGEPEIRPDIAPCPGTTDEFHGYSRDYLLVHIERMQEQVHSLQRDLDRAEKRLKEGEEAARLTYDLLAYGRDTRNDVPDPKPRKARKARSAP